MVRDCDWQVLVVARARHEVVHLARLVFLLSQRALERVESRLQPLGRVACVGEDRTDPGLEGRLEHVHERLARVSLQLHAVRHRLEIVLGSQRRAPGSRDRVSDLPQRLLVRAGSEDGAAQASCHVRPQLHC